MSIDATFTRELGVRGLRFSELQGRHPALQPFVWSRLCGWQVDLSLGYDGYVERKLAEGVRRIPEFLRRRRQAERVLGGVALRVGWNDRVLERLVEL